MGTCLLKNSNFDQTKLLGILVSNRGPTKIKKKIKIYAYLMFYNYGLECIKVSHNFVVNLLVTTPKIYNTCSEITSMWS